jgi:uncharacterized protein YdeI (YjbR/CyaY-like superfamily)
MLDGKPVSRKLESGAEQFGKLTSVKDLPARSKLMKLVKDAAKLNESGAVVPRAPRSAPRPVQVPPELSKALHKNAKARAVFEAFPPSHKREYVDWIVEAKTEETRQRRLDQAIEWIAEGKQRNWKYMPQKSG